ncbi:Ff.00g065090.m01.CDS01 [Fusarium sp. VM40]|nr:Ff.00g065090.m01.CDS01 [Fusarium sp. VM40]
MPDLNSLAETCGLVFGRDYVGKVLRDKFERQCNVIVKVMRTQEKETKVKQRPVSFSNTLPGPSTPMHDLELGRNVSREAVGVSADDDSSMGDDAMDDECLRILVEKSGTTLLV